MSLMGLDIGTTGCKSAIYTEDGLLSSVAYREYSVIYPQEGYSELDSVQVFECIKETIKEATSRIKNDPVKALSISSLGEAVTPVSKDKKILYNSILSSDTRGEKYINNLLSEISPTDFYNINPNMLSTSYSLPKILWLRDNCPDIFNATDKFLLWGDLLTYLLGGEPVISYSLANRTLLFDIHTQDWSNKLLNITGISRNTLPRPVPSGTLAGTVSRQMANELNLSENTKIIVGGHDQCCNSLGAGIYTSGRAVCGIGTYECITPSYNFIPSTETMLESGLNIEHSLIPDLYVSFLFNQGGSLLRWFRDTFASADFKSLKPGEDIYQILDSELPEDPTSLMVLPYFEATGTPKFISGVSGSILGLKMNSTRGEILKAIMECESLYFEESISLFKGMGVNINEFIATGGGAKSNQWLQIKADIFGIPFSRPREIEAGILGTIILAGIANNTFSNYSEAVSAIVKIDRTFEPNSSRHEYYIEKSAKYRQLFPLLEDYLRHL